MKNHLNKLSFILLFCITTLNFYCQTDGFSYQAVILDPSQEKLELPGVDDPYAFLIDKALDMRFTITNSNGVTEYQEIHSTKTDNFGMVNLIIGNGSPTLGVFTEIFWDGKPKEFLVEVKIESYFDPMSNQDLLYIPYALHRELIATKTTNLFDSLIVNSGSPSLLSGILTVDGATNLNNTLSVNNGSLTTLTGDLIVDGTTNLNSSLTVNNNSPTFLTGSLTVDGATNLNNTLSVNNGSLTALTGDLIVDGITNLNDSLTVNNNSPTSLTGSLTVDGATNLNNTLSVNNGSLTTLTGDLIVDGTTNLNSSLTVNNNSPTSLTGSLTVNAATNLNNSFNVNNGSPSVLSGTLVVANQTNLQDDLQVDGQVTITANLAGGQANYAAYPLRVEGSAQGIAIKLAAGTPTNNNNFITFFNSSNSAIGRIEGETAAEALLTPENIFENAMLVAEEIKAGVNVGTSFIPVVVAGLGASTGPCGACIAAAAADLVLTTANLVAFNAFMIANLGVTYQSGSADYAEWLERRNPNEKIVAGEIVGVKAGKISKYTKDANQFMAISTKPAILGNMPEDGKTHLYNKVAFMGQIPVRVKGMVFAGDYILPSGNDDGVGKAVSSDKITAKEYKYIVGIAWSDALAESTDISFVNMAIGLNPNSVAQFIEKQEERIIQLEEKFNSLENRLLSLEVGGEETKSPLNNSNESLTQKKKVIKKALPILAESNMPSELSDEVMEEAIKYLSNSYKYLSNSYK
tara:strand:+ start:961 stop:3198 length:2238 start_codon:yes stop_codon:yes gene_type:complete